MKESEVVFMGQPPLRIDFLRSIDGVNATDLLAGAIATEIDGTRINARQAPAR